MQEHTQLTQTLAQLFFFGTCFAPSVPAGSHKVIKKIYVTTYCKMEEHTHTHTHSQRHFSVDIETYNTTVP